MIYFLVDLEFASALGTYVEHWRPELKDTVSLLTYPHVIIQERLPAGTYVFTGHAGFTEAHTQIAGKLGDQLEVSGRAKLLNHPSRLLRRYSLLRTLHEQGINDFNAYRLGELPRELRYPVFVRVENDHFNPPTPLLNSERELEDAIAYLVLRDVDPSHLIVVEFEDIRDDKGLYHKFGAYRVGNSIVPRSMQFSPDWIVKHNPKNRPFQDDTLRREFLQQNPHAKEAMRTFELAHVDYGRMDYSLKDGRMQVWEINDNPVLIGDPNEKRDPVRQVLQDTFADAMRDAMVELDRGSPEGEEIEIDLAQTGDGARDSRLALL